VKPVDSGTNHLAALPAKRFNKFFGKGCLAHTVDAVNRHPGWMVQASLRNDGCQLLKANGSPHRRALMAAYCRRAFVSSCLRAFVMCCRL
jgi:hypothetical protein